MIISEVLQKMGNAWDQSSARSLEIFFLYWTQMNSKIEGLLRAIVCGKKIGLHNLKELILVPQKICGFEQQV